MNKINDKDKPQQSDGAQVNDNQLSRLIDKERRRQAQTRTHKRQDARDKILSNI